MTVLLIARVVIVPLLLGAAILHGLGIRLSEFRLSFLGWAWILGCTAVAFVTLLWLVPGLESCSPWIVDGLCLGLAGALLAAARRSPAEELPRATLAAGALGPGGPDEAGGSGPAWMRWMRWMRWSFALSLALVLAVTLVRLVMSSRYAIVVNDEAIFWSFRAKLLLENDGLNPDYIAEARRHRLPNAAYPLLNPLLHTWVYAHAERITHALNRIPIQLFSMALVLILAGGLQRLCRPWLAAVLLLLVATMGETLVGAQVAQSDVMVCCGSVMALDAWSRWQAQKHRSWVVLGAAAVALMLWAKLDGLILVSCAGLALLLTPARVLRGLRRHAAVARWALLPAGIVALTWTLNRVLESDPAFGQREGAADLVAGFLARLGERLPVIGDYVLDRILFSWRHSNGVLLGFLVLSLGLLPRWLRGELRVPTLTLLLAVLAYMAVFVLVPSKDVEWHLATAAQRLYYQLAVPATLWLGAALGRLLARPPEPGPPGSG